VDHEQPLPASISRPPAAACGDRRKPSPLGDIQPERWPHEYTSDLIDLLNVLGRLVLLEPRQAMLLDAILAGNLDDNAKLSAAGALAAPQGNGAG
jgi:hypothetical protein